MTPVQKIQFIKDLVHERVQLSPLGPIVISLNEIETFSIKDQVLVLKKLEQEGFVCDVELLKRSVGAAASMWVSSTYESQMRPKPVSSRADLITLNLGNNMLSINKQTGMVQLNDVESVLNPKSQELEVILKLATGKNHQIAYSDILGESISKTTKRNLTFVVRNLKEALGILPVKKAKNKDIIKNIKGVGYKLAP
jgi:DNA-binding response OmpR family regulator